MATVMPDSVPRRAADSQRIEQRLCRMFMLAIAGIDDGAGDFLGEKGGGSARGVANHQHIRAHGVQRHGGIDERFALFDR